MYQRGVRGAQGLAVGQLHLDRKLAETFIEAVNRCYPGTNNGSLKGAMEIVINDFLEIPQLLAPDEVERLISLTSSKTICEALAKLGEAKLKEYA